MDLDSEEDYHKYITALWFWSMNLTSKVFIIWNSYTKHKKKKRLKEALNKSQNSLNWIDDLKSSQKYFKDDFFQADLFLLAGSFTESTHYDLFKPLAESSSDSDKDDDESDDEDNTGRHLSNEKHKSPVTTCMSENLETSLDGFRLKEAEAKVFLTETASDNEFRGQDDKTCEDSGRNDGSEEGVDEEHNVNLIEDVVRNKSEDDCFKLQQEADDDDDDDDDDGNYDNEANDNCDNHQGNFGDDIDKEQEAEDEEDCDIYDNNKNNVTNVVNNHDEDNSKCSGNNDNNDEDRRGNTDDDDNDVYDDGDDGYSDEIDISSKDKLKLLSEENARAAAPVIGEFKGTTSFKMDRRWSNNNHLSVPIELECPGRQVRMKSNVDSNASVEGNVPRVRDVSTQTETVAEEVWQTCFLPPEKSSSKSIAFSHPFATETIRRSGSDSERLIPPDAFHVTEKDMHPFVAVFNDEASCNVKAFEKKLYFHPVVAKQLEHVTKDVHKTMHARFLGDPNFLQSASELPPCDQRNTARFKADVQQCPSKPFQKTCQGKEIKRYPRIVKWIDDEVGCENNGKIPFSKSREVPGIPLSAEQFQLQNSSEDISSQVQFDERSLSGENIYPPSDIVSRLCSVFNKTRSMCSGQSFAEILSQSNILESVEKSHLQQGMLERNTSSKDFETRKDAKLDLAKLDLEHVNDDCLEELEQIRKRLKDFQELKSKLERALETQEQLMEIINDKTLSGNDMHNSLNVRSLLENLKKEITRLTSRYYREESRCILIAKRAKHLLNEMYI